MKYMDSDGQIKPVRQGRWEEWTILAETKAGAMRIAQYHFYQTDKENILIN
jgi:hypothetical protein